MRRHCIDCVRGSITEYSLWNVDGCGGGVCAPWNGRAGGASGVTAVFVVHWMHADIFCMACTWGTVALLISTWRHCFPSEFVFRLPSFLVVSPVAARVKEVFTTATSSALSGSIFGLLFGLVSGTVGRKGVGPTFAAAQAQARSWGGVSAVYSGLQTAAKVARAKNDRWNNVIGACGSGAAFSCASGGGPRAALQGCVSFALFSYVIDGLVPSTGGDATKTDAELLKQ